jgi:hypothetical protein
MSQPIDLREVERRTFSVRYEDGLTDVYLGAVLLAGGLPQIIFGSAMDLPRWLSVYAVVCAVAYALTWAGKRLVSAPRLGTVRLGPAGKRRQGRVTRAMIVSLVFSVVLLTLTAAWPALIGGGRMFTSDAQVAALVAAWMLVVFTVGSYMMNFTRGYVIGVLYALGLGLGLLLQTSLPAVAAGILVVILGLVVFVRFVRRSGLPPEEAADASV